MNHKWTAFLLALVLLLSVSWCANAESRAVTYDQEKGIQEEITVTESTTPAGTVVGGYAGSGEKEAGEEGGNWSLSLGGALDEEIPEGVKEIFGSDDRIILGNQRENFPYCAVVYLEMEFSDGIHTGTGFMIGPHYVLTCGHCVYNHDAGGWAKSIRVTPAQSNGSRPYGSTYSCWTSCMSEWYYDRDFSCDLGLIKTKSDIGNKVGWFGYFYPSDSDLYNWATLIGYGAGTNYMYEASGYLNGLSYDGNIQYTVDTLPGSSGSPIMMYYNGEEGYAIGVNNCHDNTTNMGVRFTQYTVDFFKDYHGQ